MKKVKITEARKRLFLLADEVSGSGQECVLSRRGKRDVVLVDYEQWLCVRETAARYISSQGLRRSGEGSVVIKTKNLEREIRKTRQELSHAFAKSIEDF
jgi:prevent-host-death family protein